MKIETHILVPDTGWVNQGQENLLAALTCIHCSMKMGARQIKLLVNGKENRVMLGQMLQAILTNDPDLNRKIQQEALRARFS